MYKPMDIIISGASISIMGMMGIPVMQYTTLDDLVSWVGTHIEQLAQVRADIVSVVTKSNGLSSLMAFTYQRDTIQIIHLSLCMM